MIYYTQYRRGFLARLTPNGDPSTSYGNTSGFIDLPRFGLADFEEPIDLRIDCHQRAIVGSKIRGQFNNGTHFTGLSIHRYLADGSPDESLGGTGALHLASDAGALSLSGMTLDQEDRAAFVSLRTSMNSIIHRIDRLGILDAEFNVTHTRSLSPVGLAVCSDGKLVIGGTGWSQGGRIFSATRLNTDGSIDTTFGQNGYFASKLTAAFADEIALAVDVDHKDRIILVGYGEYPNQSAQSIVARLTKSGQVDASFGNNGLVIITFENLPPNATSEGWATCLAVKRVRSRRILTGKPGYFAEAKVPWDSMIKPSSIGHAILEIWGLDWPILRDNYSDILVGGAAKFSIHGKRWFVVKLLEDGDYDAQFGVNGRVTDIEFPISGGKDQIPFGIDQSTHGIVLGGLASETNYQPFYIAVSKLDHSGNRVAGFGDNGYVTIDPPGVASHQYKGNAKAVRFDKDGNVVVAGVHLHNLYA